MNHHPIRKHRRSSSEIGDLHHRYCQSQLTQAQFVKQEGICLATLARYLQREKCEVRKLFQISLPLAKARA